MLKPAHVIREISHKIADQLDQRNEHVDRDDQSFPTGTSDQISKDLTQHKAAIWGVLLSWLIPKLIGIFIAAHCEENSFNEPIVDSPVKMDNHNASTVELLMAALPTPADLKLHLATFKFDQQKTVDVTLDIFFAIFCFSTIWKLSLVGLFIANLKNIPGVYHLRLLNAFRFVLRTQRTSDGPKPDQLFQPIITSSKATLMETDLYLHKSNSTYFSDVDIARTHLICTLFSTGIEKVRGGTSGLVKGKTSSFAVALGAVSCSFRRELKPYESYDMWTRILAWDEKWLYVVTHFVKKGAKIEPNEFTLYTRQNSVNGSSRNSPRGSVVSISGGSRRDSLAGVASDESKCAIAASALSKVVFKNGRITISPEVMLEASGVLPPKPSETKKEHHDQLAETQIKANIAELAASQIAPIKTMQTVDDLESSNSESSRSRGSSVDESSNLDQWTWDMIENERKRGLKVASALAAQSLLENELNDTEALGRHTDGSGIAGVVLTLAQLGKMSNYQFL